MASQVNKSHDIKLLQQIGIKCETEEEGGGRGETLGFTSILTCLVVFLSLRVAVFVLVVSKSTVTP